MNESDATKAAKRRAMAWAFSRPAARAASEKVLPTKQLKTTKPK